MNNSLSMFLRYETYVEVIYISEHNLQNEVKKQNKEKQYFWHLQWHI